PVGVYAATRPYSLFDQIANTLAFIGFSLPTFFTGILFILIFSVKLDWLPFVYTTDIKATGIHWVLEQIRQAIMPVMVLGLFQAAFMTRFVRSAMLDVVRLDYVTTARAKGLGQARGIVKHVMRNAMIPVVTLIARRAATTTSASRSTTAARSTSTTAGRCRAHSMRRCATCARCRAPRISRC